MEVGRFFWHEHTLGAKSWKEPEIQALIKKEQLIMTKQAQVYPKDLCDAI